MSLQRPLATAQFVVISAAPTRQRICSRTIYVRAHGGFRSRSRWTADQSYALKIIKAVPYAVLLPLKSEDKLDSDEKALVDRMKRSAASIRGQDERAALSF